MANRQITNENLAMKEILLAMHKLGGQVTRKDIRQEIRENSTVFTEKQVDDIRVSKSSGQKYRPFDFTLNFAVKHLILAGFINTSDNHILTLSEKGRQIDFDSFDPEKDIESISSLDSIHRKNEQEQIINVNDDVEVKENNWEQDLLNILASMSPKKFELFCRGLLTKMGIDVDDTVGVQYIADGGLDGFGYVRSDDYRTTRVALQAKRWQGKVSAPEIDKFRGAMDKYNAEFGIFITNSDFTREAVKTARQGTRIITLINGDQICKLVAKYEYYVKPVTVYQLESFYTDPD